MFLYTALTKHHIYLGCAAVQTPLAVLNIETRPFKTVKEATKNMTYIYSCQVFTSILREQQNLTAMKPIDFSVGTPIGSVGLLSMKHLPPEW